MACSRVLRYCFALIASFGLSSFASAAHAQIRSEFYVPIPEDEALEALSDINPSSFSFLLLGIALVVMMRFRPEGFVPSRQRAAEMHTAPPGQAIGSIGLIEEEGLVPEIDPTEPGGEEDPEVAETPGEKPTGQTIAESRGEVTGDGSDGEAPR